jgi:hypothetical protein
VPVEQAVASSVIRAEHCVAAWRMRTKLGPVPANMPTWTGKLGVRLT